MGNKSYRRDKVDSYIPVSQKKQIKNKKQKTIANNRNNNNKKVKKIVPM